MRHTDKEEARRANSKANFFQKDQLLFFVQGCTGNPYSILNKKNLTNIWCSLLRAYSEISIQ